MRGQLRRLDLHCCKGKEAPKKGSSKRNTSTIKKGCLWQAKAVFKVCKKIAFLSDLACGGSFEPSSVNQGRTT